MKKGETITADAYQRLLAEQAGNRYVVIRSLQAFQALVTEYMGLPAIGRVVVTGRELAAAQAAFEVKGKPPRQSR